MTESHAALMRTCAPLYPTFALESVASLLLFCFFSYLSILISSKQQLKAPARSICTFVYTNIADWFSDTHRVLSRWPQMHEMDMGQRFRFCRRLNATICRISAFNALISITRWLHINNVNGFRYLSYSITCPLMQAELVLLIAPCIPCYRIVTMATCFITWFMLVSGYVASQFEGELLNSSDLSDLNFDNLTTKGWLIVPSVVVLSFLSLVQIPMLGLTYWRNGGSSNPNLPAGYPRLLLQTAVTWWGFPCWWMLSYEGMSVLKDTWANGIGFVTLNMISKGGFTLQMLSMVKQFKRRNAAKLEAEAESGRMSISSIETLPAFPQAKQLEEAAPRNGRKASKMSQNSMLWFVNHMKQYENGEFEKGGAGHGGASPMPSPRGQDAEDPREVRVITVVNANQLTDEQLMQELSKRLQGHSYEKYLNDEIRRACHHVAFAESSDEDE